MIVYMETKSSSNSGSSSRVVEDFLVFVYVVDINIIKFIK